MEILKQLPKQGLEVGDVEHVEKHAGHLIIIVGASVLEPQGGLTESCVSRSSSLPFRAMRSLHGYSLWSKSICLLCRLLALALEPNVIIKKCSCISAKSFQWLKALELLEDRVGRSIQLDTVLYSTVISAHAQAGWKWAHHG